MTKHPRPYTTFAAALQATKTLWIQSPLPFCPHTLPRLLIIKGQGSRRQGRAPLTPLEEPANA